MLHSLEKYLNEKEGEGAGLIPDESNLHVHGFDTIIQSRCQFWILSPATKTGYPLGEREKRL